MPKILDKILGKKPKRVHIRIVDDKDVIIPDKMGK
jgi:hypothetical protein